MRRGSASVERGREMKRTRACWRRVGVCRRTGTRLELQYCAQCSKRAGRVKQLTSGPSGCSGDVRLLLPTRRCDKHDHVGLVKGEDVCI